MPIAGQVYEIDLKPYSVRANGHTLLVQGPDGALTRRKAGPVRTLRGRVRGRSDCRVAAARLEDGLHVMVVLENGSRCWMEPLPRYAGAENIYAVYEERDIVPPQGTCDMPAAEGPDVIDEDDDRRPDSPRPGSALIARIACDTDVEFVTRHGSPAAAEARIEAIINAINVQYETQVGIRHEIATTVIRSVSDPYSASGARDRLCQLIREWTTNQTDVERDVTHLFTGARLAGFAIGIAADIGGTGICVSEGGCVGGRFGLFGSYCLAVSDFTDSFSCATDLTAHELGHLWGAFHCNCPTSTMNPAVTCANRFSATTMQSILAYRDTRECLD